MASAAALFLLCAGAAGGAVPKNGAAPVDRAAIAKALDCSRHRFEAIIHLTGPRGETQEKAVRMCGTKGESDDEWIATLKDAVRKTAASTQMPQAAKEQIIASVNAEIARLSLPGHDLPQGTDIAKLRGNEERISGTDRAEAPLSRDYNVLPPLPTVSSVPPPHLLGSDSPTAVAGPAGDVRQPVAEDVHLTLRCTLPGAAGRAESCDTIDQDTVLVLRADGAYPGGIAVRFIRDGNSGARVNLPAMAAGDTRTLPLPAAVCSGVGGNIVEIVALPANAPAGAKASRVGDYDLRC